jgi:hypothetical protein
VDVALLKLGRRPWREPRPKIVLFVRVLNGPNSFVLDRDRERERDMREAIAAAAWLLGLSIAMPESSALQKAALDPGILLQSDPSKLAALARSAGGDVAVWGSLVWAPSAHGWIADWRLHHDGETHRWREAGVSFDRAFYAAAAGAAQILSVGAPPS